MVLYWYSVMVAVEILLELSELQPASRARVTAADRVVMRFMVILALVFNESRAQVKPAK